MSFGLFFLENPVHARLPELKPVAEEGGQRVIKWEMGDAAFVDLQRSAEAGSTDRWETVLSTTSSTAFTCPGGEDSKIRYRLANPLVWKTSVVDGDLIVGRFSSLAFTQVGKPCISYEGDSPKCL